MKEHFVKSLKIAVAALVSLFIAGELGLKYSATAGIITILTIRNTKRETLKSAANRGMAYVCAWVLGAGCFRLLGYTLPAFACYLFFFAFLCMAVGWQEAITTNSVLISHFLSEGSMDLAMFANETLLFVIGTGTGIVVNLHLHSRIADFERLAGAVDDQIRHILRMMVIRLSGQDAESSYFLLTADRHFDGLEETLRRAKLCASANYNNSLFCKDTYQLDYLRMREQQTVLLKGIYHNICRLSFFPGQTGQVAALFADVEQAYHRENTVKELLDKLLRFLSDLRLEALPETREEFEARAILYYILLQMEELLLIKRRFVEGRH